MSHASDEYEKIIAGYLTTGVSPPSFTPYLGLFPCNNPRQSPSNSGQIGQNNPETFETTDGDPGYVCEEITWASAHGYTRVSLAGNFQHHEEKHLNYVTGGGTPIHGPWVKDWYATFNTITFPTCTGTAWGQISGYAVFDAQTGGDAVFYGQFDNAQTVQVGSTLKIEANYAGYHRRPDQEGLGLALYVD